MINKLNLEESTACFRRKDYLNFVGRYKVTNKYLLIIDLEKKTDKPVSHKENWHEIFTKYVPVSFPSPVAVGLRIRVLRASIVRPTVVLIAVISQQLIQWLSDYLLRSSQQFDQ